jgi:primosomal protein N''
VAVHRLDACGLPQGSNAFTLSRFLVPWFMGFQGRAIFADGADMLCLGDIAELAALADEQAPVSRASISLRVVPGEFDLRWVGLIAQVVREQPPAVAHCRANELKTRLSRLSETMDDASQTAAALLHEAMSDDLKRALALTEHLLNRLRRGLTTTGLWQLDPVSSPIAAEVEAVEGELRYRLRCIERAVRLRAGLLTDQDTQRLDRVCQRLRISA